MARQTAYQKAIRKLQEEGDRQCRLIYGAAGLALHRHWGWRKKRIISIMELTSVVWNECTSDPEKSMIQICEAETACMACTSDNGCIHGCPSSQGRIRL